jgi:hypothetical protein
VKKILNIIILAAVLMVAANAHAFVLNDFAVFGEKGVHVGAGSDVKGGLTGSNTLITMNGASSIEGAAGAGTFTAANGIKSFGDILYDGNVTIGSTGNIYGDINADGTVKIGSGTDVYGNVIATGNITVGSLAIVHGTKTPNGSPAVYTPFTLPSATNYTAGGANITKASGITTALAAGTYGNLNLGLNNVLKLSAGNYYFDSLKLGSGTDIQFDLTNGDIFLYVIGDVTWGNGIDSFKVGGGEVHTELHGKWAMGGAGNYYGTVFAPFGDIHISNGSVFEGALYSGAIVDLEHDVTINFVPAPEPLTLTMFGAGILGALRLRRKESVIS